MAQPTVAHTLTLQECAPRQRLSRRGGQSGVEGRVGSIAVDGDAVTFVYQNIANGEGYSSMRTTDLA